MPRIVGQYQPTSTISAFFANKQVREDTSHLKVDKHKHPKLIPGVTADQSVDQMITRRRGPLGWLR